LSELVSSGRLPITENNIGIIEVTPGRSTRSLINERSSDAALILTGFRTETLKQNGETVLGGYDNTGTILFVNSQYQKEIV